MAQPDVKSNPSTPANNDEYNDNPSFNIIPSGSSEYEEFQEILNHYLPSLISSDLIKFIDINILTNINEEQKMNTIKSDIKDQNSKIIGKLKSLFKELSDEINADRTQKHEATNIETAILIIETVLDINSIPIQWRQIFIQMLFQISFVSPQKVQKFVIECEHITPQVMRQCCLKLLHNFFDEMSQKVLNYIQKIFDLKMDSDQDKILIDQILKLLAKIIAKHPHGIIRSARNYKRAKDNINEHIHKLYELTVPQAMDILQIIHRNAYGDELANQEAHIAKLMCVVGDGVLDIGTILVRQLLHDIIENEGKATNKTKIQKMTIRYLNDMYGHRMNEHHHQTYHEEERPNSPYGSTNLLNSKSKEDALDLMEIYKGRWLSFNPLTALLAATAVRNGKDNESDSDDSEEEEEKGIKAERGYPKAEINVSLLQSLMYLIVYYLTKNINEQARDSMDDVEFPLHHEHFFLFRKELFVDGNMKDYMKEGASIKKPMKKDQKEKPDTSVSGNANMRDVKDQRGKPDAYLKANEDNKENDEDVSYLVDELKQRLFELDLKDQGRFHQGLLKGDAARFTWNIGGHTAEDVDLRIDFLQNYEIKDTETDDGENPDDANEEKEDEEWMGMTDKEKIDKCGMRLIEPMISQHKIYDAKIQEFGTKIISDNDDDWEATNFMMLSIHCKDATRETMIFLHYARGVIRFIPDVDIKEFIPRLFYADIAKSKLDQYNWDYIESHSEISRNQKRENYVTHQNYNYHDILLSELYSFNQ